MSNNFSNMPPGWGYSDDVAAGLVEENPSHPICVQAIDPKKCNFCQDIDELEIDFPDEPHHGGIRYCAECDAEYYEERGGTRWAANDTAKLNHPELKTI